SCAIQKKIRILSSRAAQRILTGRALSNISNFLKLRVAVLSESYAGAECGEIEVVAAVQRQIHDPLIVDNLADGARFRIEQRRLAHNVYRFTHLPKFQLYIDAGLLVYLQLEGWDSGRPKTSVFYRDGIVSGRKASESIGATISGACRMRNIAINIRHDYLRVRNYRTACIGNQAGDAACADLCQTDVGNQSQGSCTDDLEKVSCGAN